MQTSEDTAIKDTEYEVVADEIIAEAKEQAPERGFDIEKFYYQGFGNQGDGASWTGDVWLTDYIEWRLKNGGIDGLEDVTLEVMYWLFEGGVFDRKINVTAGGHYCHDKTMSLSDFYWTFMGNNDTETMGKWGGPFADTPVKELLQATGWPWEVDALANDTNDNYDILWKQVLKDARDYAVTTYKRLEDAYYAIYFG